MLTNPINQVQYTWFIFILKNMWDLDKVSSSEIKNNEWALQAEVNYFWDKFNAILEYWLSVVQQDKTRINNLIWTFHLLWWESVAEKINIQSRPVTSKDYDVVIKFGWDMPYQLTERQRKKAIVILLWMMLIYYARQSHKPIWPMDEDIEIIDIKEYIKFFWIDDEIFLLWMEFARKYYKVYFKEEIPKWNFRLEEFM